MQETKDFNDNNFVVSKGQREYFGENKEVLEHYGKVIRKYRLASPFDVKELCRRVQISRTQLYSWENAASEPRLHHVLALCKVLNIPLSEMFRTEIGKISPEESSLVKVYRSLDPSIKAKALSFFKSFCKIIDDNTPESINEVQAIESEPPVEIRRKRGRPRIHPLPDPDAIIPHKGRGRPRKNAAQPLIPEKQNTSLEDRVRIVKDCIENGTNYGETAAKYNITYSCVYRWVNKFKESGEAGLIDHRGKARRK